MLVIHATKPDTLICISGANYYSKEGTLFIERLYIESKIVKTIGIYPLTSNSFNGTKFESSFYNNTDTTYSLTSGTMTITFIDTLQKIVSGEFELSASNGSEVLNITKGQFDIRYN